MVPCLGAWAEGNGAPTKLKNSSSHFFLVQICPHTLTIAAETWNLSDQRPKRDKLISTTFFHFQKPSVASIILMKNHSSSSPVLVSLEVIITISSTEIMFFAKETWQDLHQSKRHCGWTLACKYLRPQDGHPHHNHHGHHAKCKMQISEATWWSIGDPHHNHYDGHHCLWGKLSDADEEGDLGQRGPRADAEGMIRQPQWSSRL